MTKEQLIKKFSNTYSHLLKEGMEVIGIVNLLGDEVLYVIHPLLFDGRQLPTSYHGYALRSGFSDEEFPAQFYDEKEEEYLFSPSRFEAYVKSNQQEIQNKLNVSSLDECLDAICFGNFLEYKESYAALNN